MIYKQKKREIKRGVSFKEQIPLEILAAKRINFQLNNLSKNNIIGSLILVFLILLISKRTDKRKKFHLKYLKTPRINIILIKILNIESNRSCWHSLYL